MAYLTGGQTARGVLDTLGVGRLDPLAELTPGAVLSRDADGRRYVTRPGSFGDPDSLVHTAHTLLGRPALRRTP